MSHKHHSLNYSTEPVQELAGPISIDEETIIRQATINIGKLT